MRFSFFRAATLSFALASCGHADNPNPPLLPDAGVSASQDVTTFAIDSIELGDSSDGGLSATAWKSFGYDLDGKTTTDTSRDVCALAPGAPVHNQVDGNAGRDDAFASVIMPIIETIIQPACLFCPSPTIVASTVVTNEIARGQYTLQLRVTGLSSTADQTATGLAAQVFSSDAFDPDGGAIPPFTTTTDWPVQAESVNDSATVASGAKAMFSAAYIVGGTFVAGTNELVAVPFHLQLLGLPFTLIIHSAIITFVHVGPTAGSGIIAGVIETEELVAAFRQLAGTVSRSLCGPAFDGIANQLRQAADIMLDRTNTAESSCTGISVGLAFHATQIANPTRVAPPVAMTDPCPASDAGAD